MGLPKWVGELDFKQFFADVQRDALNATKMVSTAFNPLAIPQTKSFKDVFNKIGSGIGSGVKKVFSFLTPNLILVVVILILAIILWGQIKRIFEAK